MLRSIRLMLSPSPFRLTVKILKVRNYIASTRKECENGEVLTNGSLGCLDFMCMQLRARRSCITLEGPELWPCGSDSEISRHREWFPNLGLRLVWVTNIILVVTAHLALKSPHLLILSTHPSPNNAPSNFRIPLGPHSCQATHTPLWTIMEVSPLLTIKPRQFLFKYIPNVPSTQNDKAYLA